MVLGKFFGSKTAKGAVSPMGATEANVGYIRLAFPVWSIPGVRVISNPLAIEHTSRSEIELLFSLELRRARLGVRLSPSEVMDLEISRTLRRALYDDRIAA